MWYEVYNTRTFSVSSHIRNNYEDYQYDLIRIEYDHKLKPHYVIKYSGPTNGYLYGSISRNEQVALLVINEYMANRLNPNKLFDIKLSAINNIDIINMIILVNTDLLTTYQYSSALVAICGLRYSNEFQEYNTSMLLNESYIPNNSIKSKESKRLFKKPGFKVDLFDYQKKSIQQMISIEAKSDVFIPISVDLNFNGTIIKWDPINQSIVPSTKLVRIESNGGILADSMGLGKTISLSGLIHYSPPLAPPTPENSFYYSKANLIIVPSHLAKQWAEELKKSLPSNIKIISILTKTTHSKYTFNDFKEADIIICTQQFLLNVKNYMLVMRKHCNTYNRESFSTIFAQWEVDKVDLSTKTEPLFEFFMFHRIIIDEGHELFERNLGNYRTSDMVLTFINSLKSHYRWYISGTPFSSFTGLSNILNFIDTKLSVDGEIINIHDLSYDGCKIRECTNRVYTYIVKTHFMQEIFKSILIRHKKTDIETSISIPGYTETVEWVELTSSERTIYDSRKVNTSSETLQQLCCHPLIADSMRRIIGSTVTDLDQVQDKLLEHHKKQVKTYSEKIVRLDTTSQSYNMVLAKYKSIVSESSYMLKVLEKISTAIAYDEDTNCIICFDSVTDPVLTPCGHIYCNICITTSLNYKSECPMCKNKLEKGQLYKIESSITKQVDINPLIAKYGAKLGKLIQMVRSLMIGDNRIIIFSQWDDMLSLIGKSLSENGVENSFIKGNVYCRANAIQRFKLNTNENRVIMLSLKNSASGTNLTEATHIFFVEPMNLSKNECAIIEGQALCRACRIGQKNVVQIIRILCKNTIEEEIYNRVYV